MSIILILLIGAVSLQNFEIDHSLDLYQAGGPLFLPQQTYMASSYTLPDTYEVDISNYHLTVTDIKITFNFTSFSSSFTPTVASNNLTLTSTSTDQTAIKLEYHYQCTNEGTTGSVTTNANTNSIIYTFSWDFDGTTQAPLVNYSIKEFKFLVNLDETKACTPPQQAFSDFISPKFEALVKAAWDPHPPTWGAKTFENNYQFSMLNDQGVSENFKLTLTKSAVTPPLFAMAPVAFKYTYAVTYVPPSQSRNLVQEKKPQIKPQSQNLKAGQSVCTIFDAALLYNITSGSLKNILKDPFTITWSNIPADTSYPFPSMELRQLYLLYPSIVDLKQAKDNMTFQCTFTPPASYMLVTSLSYTLQASCVVNHVDSQGASTTIWTDTFTISADASISTETTDACTKGTHTFKSVLSPINTLSSTDTSADADKLNLPVLQEFQKLAYQTFLKDLTSNNKIPNFAPTCFNPVMSGATAAPTVTLSITGVKACFDVDFS